jgi:hypothetical protein
VLYNKKLSLHLPHVKTPFSKYPVLTSHCNFPKTFQQKRDSSLTIDMNKGSGANELVQAASATEEEICETPQDEERLQEVCNS